MAEAAPAPSRSAGRIDTGFPHIMLLPVPIVCFFGALITDVVYSTTALIVWLDFSNWLILAGLIAGAVAAIVLLIDFIGTRRLRDSALARVHLAFFSAALIVELFNMFIHDRDGWRAVVPTGFALSIIGVVLALIAGWCWRWRWRLLELTP